MSRFWQVFLLLALFGVFYVGGTIAQNATAPKVIRAQKFELVDEKGNVRGVFGSTEESVVILELYDEEDKPRGAVTVSRDGDVILALGDKKGELRSAFGVSGEGDAMLALADSKGEARCMFGVSKDGDAGFELADDKGNPRVTLTMLDGNPVTKRNDDKGEILWSVP